MALALLFPHLECFEVLFLHIEMTESEYVCVTVACHPREIPDLSKIQDAEGDPLKLLVLLPLSLVDVKAYL